METLNHIIEEAYKGYYGTIDLIREQAKADAFSQDYYADEEHSIKLFSLLREFEETITELEQYRDSILFPHVNTQIKH